MPGAPTGVYAGFTVHGVNTMWGADATTAALRRWTRSAASRTAWLMRAREETSWAALPSEADLASALAADA